MVLQALWLVLAISDHVSAPGEARDQMPGDAHLFSLPEHLRWADLAILKWDPQRERLENTQHLDVQFLLDLQTILKDL